MNRRCSTHQLSSMPFIDCGFQQQTDSEPYPNRSPYKSFILFLSLLSLFCFVFSNVVQEEDSKVFLSFFPLGQPQHVGLVGWGSSQQTKT